MQSASVQVRGWTLGIATLAAVAIGGGWMLWGRSDASASASSAQAMAVQPGAVSNAGEPGVKGAWLPTVFASLPADGRQRARASLASAGIPFTGDGFVRTIRAGHEPFIGLFRQGGIDLNAADENGRTPLLAAALEKNWRLCTELVTAGADVNRADKSGMTPLMAAALADQTNALQMLFAKSAAVDAVDVNGHGALHYAVAGGSIGAMKALLQQGAVCTGACCSGRDGDLLEHALARGDWQMIEPVLKGQPEGLKWRSSSRAALQAVLQTRDGDKVRLLLSKHAAAPTPEGRAQPLLAYALLAGNLDQFRFLLDCGASPDTPLNSPVEKPFSQAVNREFLRHYLDEEGGMTTLMLAAGLGKADFVRALIDKGAKRGLGTDKYKMPAMLFAAHTEDADVMQMLIGDCPKPEEMRIEISLGSQHASVIRNGQSVIDTRISTGRAGFSTPTGRFVITDKHLSHKSTIYKVDMPFFMRLNCRDFGMHQGVVPNYPASHGCIRLPGDMARRLFKDVPVGTLVTIRE